MVARAGKMSFLTGVLLQASLVAAHDVYGSRGWDGVSEALQAPSTGESGLYAETQLL